MVGNTKFKSVNYIDLFAGCGICAVDVSGQLKRYPGSAILAAGCTKPFNNLIFVEQNYNSRRHLLKRIENVKTVSHVTSFVGDVNLLIDDVARAIPDRSLNVAFVDPFSLDVHYTTIERIASRHPLDLLILFADDIDLIRNVEKYYYPNPQSKLDLFLGENSQWRNDWNNLEVRNAPNLRKVFADIYLRQLRRLGYSYTDQLPIPCRTRSLYRLIYASKVPLGLKFWNIAKVTDINGTRNLFGY